LKFFCVSAAMTHGSSAAGPVLVRRRLKSLGVWCRPRQLGRSTHQVYVRTLVCTRVYAHYNLCKKKKTPPISTTFELAGKNSCDHPHFHFHFNFHFHLQRANVQRCSETLLPAQAIVKVGHMCWGTH